MNRRLREGGKQRDKKAWFGAGRLVALNILEGRSFWEILHNQYVRGLIRNRKCQQVGS